MKVFRSLFLSDFHLGSRNCQGDRLLRFLRSHDAATIYLVGDVIEMSLLTEWPSSHVECFKELFRMGLNGTKIVFVPGNHDWFFRNHLGAFGNLSVERESTHIAVDGRKFLVLHGDKNDYLKSRWSLKIAIGLDLLFGASFWELARTYCAPLIRRHNVTFRQAMVELAKLSGSAGVICGHVHMPNIETVDGIFYMNCGDWTHHCTAIAEDGAGVFSILQDEP